MALETLMTRLEIYTEDNVKLWFVWVLTIVYIHQLSSYGWFRKG